MKIPQEAIHAAIAALLLATEMIEVDPDKKHLPGTHYRMKDEKDRIIASTPMPVPEPVIAPVPLPRMSLAITPVVIEEMPVAPTPKAKKLPPLGREQEKILWSAKKNEALWNSFLPSAKKSVLRMEKRGLIVVKDNKFCLIERHRKLEI